jgi:hypothetical protein
VTSHRALEELLGSYLHMDWSEEHSDVWSAIDDFMTDNPSMAPELVTEAQSMLDTHDEEQLAQWVGARTTGYYPPGDGMTYHQWLERLRDRAKSFD